MSTKNIRWLLSELPELVNRSIITAEQQHAITGYYHEKTENRPNIALIAFSIFGSILVAAGIILLLAHNWSDLPRPVRTVLSFLPLVIGQGIGFYTLVRRGTSIAWREGIASFILLATGSSIALISQTYHIQGELTSFLFTWMLLALPLVYVFGSTTAVVLFLAGAVSWAIASAGSHSTPHAFWLLLAAIIPVYLLKNRSGRHPKQTTIIGWCIALSCIAGVSVGCDSISEGYRAITFIALFLILHFFGILFPLGGTFWSNPFHNVGISGLAVTYLFLSYGDSWDGLSYQATKTLGGLPGASVVDWVIGVGFPLLAVVLLVVALRRKNLVSLGLAAGLPLAYLGFGFSDTTTGQAIFTTLFNCYVLAGGIAFLVSGIRAHVPATVNFGFALVAAVIVLRFFDSNLSFVLRGVLFVVLGAGFLSTNIVLARRKVTS